MERGGISGTEVCPFVSLHVSCLGGLVWLRFTIKTCRPSQCALISAVSDTRDVFLRGNFRTNPTAASGPPGQLCLPIVGAAG